MRVIGSTAWTFGVFEIRKLIAAFEPIALTAFITWATGYIGAMHSAGGWRAIIASVVVMVWTGFREYAADNSRGRM
jgi:hypothetical protein